MSIPCNVASTADVNKGNNSEEANGNADADDGYEASNDEGSDDFVLNSEIDIPTGDEDGSQVRIM